jgi:hypothetical protein
MAIGSTVMSHRPCPAGLIAVLAGALGGIASIVWVAIASLFFLVRSCI